MKESAYKEAGVDIDAGAALVERIKPHIKKTNRTGVMSGLGGFGALFDLKAAGYNDPVLVSSTDGVGTKIKIAIDCKMHETIGIDLVAMCVNDLVVQGAEPLFFLDYFATGKLDNDIAETVIAGVARGCEMAGCALIGGETAEMPGLYAAGDYDLAGFTVGAVDRSRMITGENIQAGDVILGLASSGIHSNGYSLVRHLVKTTQGLNYKMKTPFDNSATLAESLMIPTRIYVKSLLRALAISDAAGRPAIRGIAHITGGGLTENIPRILPDDMTARIDTSSWPLPPVFQWLKEIGQIEDTDLARTLNCGLGMVVVCSPEQASEIEEILLAQKEAVYHIGAIGRRFGGPAIILENTEKAWALKS